MFNRQTLAFLVSAVLTVTLAVGSLPPVLYPQTSGNPILTEESSPPSEPPALPPVSSVPEEKPEISEEAPPPVELPEAMPPQESSPPESAPPESSSSSQPPAPSTPEPEPPTVSESPETPPMDTAPPPDGPLLVGYYPSYARSSGFTPGHLRADMLTHIHYAFANIGDQHTLTLPNPATDRKNLLELVQLKEQYPHLSIILSVGGWDYSYNFSKAAATSSSRAAFAESCAEMLLEYNLDGIDLDWEFPGKGDRQNFTLLLQAIRGRLDSLANETGRHYSLSVAGSPSQSYRDSIQLKSVAGLVDYLFLMGYDIHGPWDSYADLNAPLYAPQEDSPQYVLSLQQAVDGYIAQGLPAQKLVLGMPFYGYRYLTNGQTEDGLYSTFSAAKSLSYDRIVADYLTNPAFWRQLHREALVPYLTDGETFISYDDADSIAEKTTFAVERGLAGVGAWELSQDRSAHLLSSAYHVLRP